MGATGKYAAGTEAWGLCQKCGLRFLLHELVLDDYFPGLRVCESCYDTRQPQEFPISVGDPQALYRPSPEWMAIPPMLEGTGTAATVALDWSEALSQGGPRVDQYDVYRSDSADGVFYSDPVRLIGFPVDYYADFGPNSLADLVEGGNPPHPNHGISHEVLTYFDEGLGGLKFFRYKIIARLNGGRLISSNVLEFDLPPADATDSLAIAGVITAGTLGGVFESLESLLMAGVPTGGTLDLAGICETGFGNVVLQISGAETVGATTFHDESLTDNIVSTTGAAAATASQQLFVQNTINLPSAGAGLTVPVAPGSLLDLSTPANDSWTIEGWLFPDTVAALTKFFSMGNSPTNGLALSFNAGGVLSGTIEQTAGAQAFDSNGHIINAGAWNHFALVNNAGSLTVYANGVPGLPVAIGALVAFNGLVKIGEALGTTIQAQMANIRITYGMALYVTTFTPPIAPFSNLECSCDPDFGGTLLLLHLDGSNGQTSTVDSSSYALTCTFDAAFGATLSNADPAFGSAALHVPIYSPVVQSNSAVGVPFNYGDPIDIFNTSEWTIEGWIRPSTNNGGNANQSAFLVNYGGGSAGNNADFCIQLTAVGDGVNFHTTMTNEGMFSVGGVADSLIFPCAAGVWHHMALVQQPNGTAVLYVDGIRRTASAPGGGYLASGYLRSNPIPQVSVGGPSIRFSGPNLDCMVDEFRVSNFARYLTNFNPAQLAFGPHCDCDPDFGGVVLLLHFDGTDGQATATDSSLVNNAVSLLAGAGFLSTADPKFGTACFEYNGSGAAFSNSACAVPITLGSPLDIFRGPSWTIECFFRVPNPGSSPYVFNYGPNRTTANFQSFVLQVTDNGDGTTFINCNDAEMFGTLAGISGTITTASNLWHHFAVVKDQLTNTATMYVDGVSLGVPLVNVWNSANYVNGAPHPVVCLGNFVQAVTNAPVFVDEFRVSNFARYKTNFTPTSAPFGEACS